MKLTKEEAEAVEWLREWVSWGMRKRADGSFPTDFLTCIRRLGKVPDTVSSRELEKALVAGPDMDYLLRHRANRTIKTGRNG